MVNDPCDDRPGLSARARDSLETIVLIALFVTVFTALLFGLRYESYTPYVGTFSIGYLTAGLVPVVFLLCAVCSLLLMPSLRQAAPNIKHRGVALVVYGSSIPAGVVVAMWAAHIPESRMALALGIAVASLGGLVASRVFGRPQLVLCVLPVVLFSAVLMVVEVPLLLRPTPVRWGDDALFAFIHPPTPPFMNPGGRLRAGVDRDQMSAEFPGGAAVRTNRDGFRNAREFSRSPGYETRVLSLGDSFSTGYAMPQDRFFGSELEWILQDMSPQGDAVVLNAEVSNPAHGLYYLQEFGLNYNPRVVVYGLSGNDLVQTEHFCGPDALFKRGDAGRLVVNPGADRKRSSPILRYRDFTYPVVAPESGRSVLTPVRRAGEQWLSHFARFSVFSWLSSSAVMNPRPVPMFSYAEELEAIDGRKRLIDGQADLGLFYPDGQEQVEGIYRRFFGVLDSLRQVSEAAGAAFVLVIYPQRFQIQPQDWQAMCERWSLDPQHFDLTLLNRRIASYCRETGTRCIDLLKPMHEGAHGQALYLPGGDMHFNSKGCRLAAEITAETIGPLLVHAKPTAELLDDDLDPR